MGSEHNVGTPEVELPPVNALNVRKLVHNIRVKLIRRVIAGHVIRDTYSPDKLSRPTPSTEPNIVEHIESEVNVDADTDLHLIRSRQNHNPPEYSLEVVRWEKIDKVDAFIRSSDMYIFNRAELLDKSPMDDASDSVYHHSTDSLETMDDITFLNQKLLERRIYSFRQMPFTPNDLVQIRRLLD